ncbi:hypothetical protein C815_01168 [Firmicutes bacterium M10-2]|nr:hypothetical protein C815_01168 [Firmicutes bacterium M10-2]
MKKNTKQLISLLGLGAAVGSLIFLNEKTYRFVFGRKKKELKPPENTTFDRIEAYKTNVRAKLKDLEQEQFVRISKNNEKLYATLYPNTKPSHRYVICVHGYHTDGIHEFCAFVPYYLEHGMNVLLIDQRSHGKSDGKDITFGLQEGEDLLDWIYWLIKHFGEDIEIILHGISMGAATVMEVSSIVPEQVKFIVEDCGYTEANKEFKSTLKMMRLPTGFSIWLSYLFFIHNLRFLRHIKPIEEVEHSKVPILFVHGKKDPLVPFEMAEKLYEICPSPKDRLFVENAEHAQSFYLEPKAYKEKLDQFIQKYTSH